jgi:erythromycin esterase-like protein
MSWMIRLFPIWFAIAAQAQPYLNLDFETATRGQPWYWSTSSAGYEYAVDATDFQSGNQSFRIRNVNAPPNGLGVASQRFPIELVRGKRVRVSGWIKTANITSGYAAIWWRVDGPSGSITLDNMAGTGPSGTTGWTNYQFERDISPDGVAIVFGVFLAGNGTAWFDGLKIEVDGVKLQQGAGPHIGEPTKEQLDWVSTAAIPIAGADPGLNYDDLTPLKDLIGSAHIVGLGEATHGTSEFFRMKHRIIDFLANQMGFTIFSIEANMPEAYRVNDYVLNGKGDPKELLKGMYFWTWNTQEVLDMILWMREFNSSGKGRIQFTGFDMQTPDVAAQIARDFITKADPDYVGELNGVYTQLQKQSAGVQGFGVATGTFPVAVAAGKRLRYTGFIKTQGITTGYAGLWWRVDGQSGVLAFDNMSNRGARGTIDWTPFEINLSIPANATNINFGVLHPGNGTAWFDTLAVELDGMPYVDNTRFDFDFESPTPLGFSTGGAGFSVQLDTTVAHTGKQSLRSTYNGGPTLSTAEIAAQCAAVVAHMESARDTYLSQNLAAQDIDWAIQNARIVAQAADLARNSAVRDPDMAANITWIIDHAPPGSKVVLWAHDYHVSRYDGAMGSYLAARYGTDYVVLGFGFHEGSYNAVGSQGLRPYNANPSFPGSAEYVSHQTGMPRFILDLRQASLDNPGSAWLLDDVQFRTIGAVPVDGFAVTRLVHDYDALIYFDHSSPSVLLPF